MRLPHGSIVEAMLTRTTLNFYEDFPLTDERSGRRPKKFGGNFEQLMSGQDGQLP